MVRALVHRGKRSEVGTQTELTLTDKLKELRKKIEQEKVNNNNNNNSLFTKYSHIDY